MTPMGRFWPTWIVATKLPPTRRTWTTTLRLPSQAKLLTCRCTAFADTLGRHVSPATRLSRMITTVLAPCNTLNVQVFAVAGCSEARYATGGGDDKAFLWSVRAPPLPSLEGSLARLLLTAADKALLS